jgi:hypothetical protein
LFTSPYLLTYFSSLNLISFHSTTLNPYLSSLSSYSVYLHTVPPKGVVIDDLNVLKLAPKLPLCLAFKKVRYWVRTMSQINSVNILLRYKPKIQSNIIFSSSRWPTEWGFWMKFLHASLSSFMPKICPFHLMLLNWPNHSITNKDLDGFWRRQNSSTSNSHCKTYRLTCGTG